jgi:hypothetical protein
LRARLRDPVCRNCGSLREPAELDDQRWCAACRQRLIPRSAIWARVSAVLVTILVGAWIALAIRPTRFVIVWMVILAMTYFVVSKIAQRVAFEVIRWRGVPGREEKQDE